MMNLLYDIKNSSFIFDEYQMLLDLINNEQYTLHAKLIKLPEYFRIGNVYFKSIINDNSWIYGCHISCLCVYPNGGYSEFFVGYRLYDLIQVGDLDALNYVIENLSEVVEISVSEFLLDKK